MSPDHDIETEIARWRAYLGRHRPALSPDADELEAHLRDQIADLTRAGLSPQEAFLIALRRLGSLDALSREFAREHSDRLWKQLVLPGESGGSARRDVVVALLFALGAALAVKVPAVVGLSMDDDAGWFVLNAGLLVLPFLAGWFAWRRRAGAPGLAVLAALFVAGAVAANVYPLVEGGATMVLTALHLPILLWFVVGLAHAGMAWRDRGRRMDFVRFTGEWAIYYALFALGGGVLAGMSLAVFSAIGVNVERAVAEWVLPMGAAGAVLVAALLVEAKQSVVENMAPVLTRVFTPLFTLLLLAFLVAMGWTRNLVEVDREVLIVFDLLLVVVLGLTLYAMSARDAGAPPGWFERLQLLLVGSALLVDMVGLVAMAQRIALFGVSANKAAALGLNLLLLANLAWLGWLLLGFLRRRRPFAALESWQMRYLPLYAAWAAVVVAVFPPVFGFQ